MAMSRLTEALADRYRIERELGQGGMATVYLAHDLKHDRRVAVKVLRPELAQILGLERFQREIRTVAGLHHPHILPVYDSGESAGQLWFTMPFVEGESLRDRLNREKQLSLDDALHITRNLVSALSYAHGRGIIHRDVKPENILLTSGEAILADFGIARAIGEETERLTRTGMAIGTPAYMSPEQASGDRALDGRTDIYAVSAVLYEMLAGEPPYTGPTAQAILARVLTEPLRPIHPRRAAVSRELDAVIAKAMATTPADRYATMADFGGALVARVGPPVTESVVAAPTVTERPATARRLSGRLLLAMLLLGFVLGLGVLYAWRHARSESSGPRLVAVLPFENQGAAEDEYFADGVADEIRGKLSELPGLQVIARASSTPYKKTTKPLQEIARELGVRYLLTATVRWEKSPGKPSQVHVSPELVEVSSGSTPHTRWEQPFDAALTDVFQVQADIAGRVAQALNVVLGDSAKRELAEKPTQNLAAWDAYLRGEAASAGMSAVDAPSLRRAVAAYEQAVTLDSTFAMAWAQLSRAHSYLYRNNAPTLVEAEAARRAADRALVLAPNRPEGHMAQGGYLRGVRGDYLSAFREDSTAFALTPGNADLLTDLANAEYPLGRWDMARAHLVQADRLDPRSVRPARNLAFVLLCTRHYAEAQQAADRALALAPTNLSALAIRSMVSLAQGDLAGGRAVLRAAPKDVDSTALVVFMTSQFDLGWVLEDAQQQLLLRLSPSAFDNNRAAWAIALAQIHALRGELFRARVYADSARTAFEELLRAVPNDPDTHSRFGLVLASLGRKSDAIREGERSMALALTVGDSTYTQSYLVRIYILAGKPEKAVNLLEPLLKTPYYLSPGWLKIDPTFDPLRKNPRFQKLVGGV